MVGSCRSPFERFAHHNQSYGDSPSVATTVAVMAGTRTGETREAATATAFTGREQWLRAGQQVLRERGITGVKLQSLTAVLGLSTGSFYHHFSGMPQYLRELASYFGAEQLAASLASVQDRPPIERLRAIGRIARDDRMQPLHAAMRDWAAHDAGAADAVRAADEQLLRFVEQAFVDLGHDTDGARTRALLMFSVGVARVDPPWKVSGRILDDVLEVLAPG